ncbi:class I SAM-dependent methyltransferase [Streptomyces viridochromogenes]|uniref:class I SAM-dependent methyltransferase n=1 Tax=Streptomyces viridochromogenes TaxID=1938 RepID=UPI00069DB10A|nr:class I SAM-dependent methyltransferase [Streptomyces viridochromogenes]KOG08778.1 lipoprotein [Streptomyces viridochromogenes]KOG09120.1 lipoprotein [Streptomyces viridochromogenes]
MTERDVRLGTVQETLLIPLYGRAVENRKKEAVLRDPVAEELVAAIDYDFARFDGLPSLLGTVLRTSLFDRWVADFLAEHPTGTVIEIGTGLNTRYERTDNGQARWFDLDLPDVIELRRTFFTDTPRRTMIAASVTDEAWADTVAAHSGGPYLFAAEAVLPYLRETDVRKVIGLLGDRFPGSLLALDTSGPGHFDTQDQDDALGKVRARMQWACADPARLAEWRPGVDVLASHTFSSLPSRMYDELPTAYQEMLSGLAAQRLRRVEDYRLNLVRLP